MTTIIIASIAFAVGGLVMKAAEGFSRPLPSITVAALFVFGAYMLSKAVARDGLTVTYVVGLGVEAIAAAIFGVIVLGERPSSPQLLGLAAVVGGLVLVRSASA
ncbi:MAG: DMT family transporter [Acidimicrobiia bacterium]